MDSLKFYLGPPCPTFLRPTGPSTLLDTPRRTPMATGPRPHGSRDQGSVVPKGEDVVFCTKPPLPCSFLFLLRPPLLFVGLIQLINRAVFLGVTKESGNILLGSAIPYHSMRVVNPQAAKWQPRGWSRTGQIHYSSLWIPSGYSMKYDDATKPFFLHCFAVGVRFNNRNGIVGF
jgi:hypothetical protein